MKTLKIILMAMFVAISATAKTPCEELKMEALLTAEKAGNEEAFERELKRLLPVGSDEARVVCVLEKLGWGHIYDKEHNGYFASKKLKRGFFIKSQVNIEVILDEAKTVKEIDVYVNATSLFG